MGIQISMLDSDERNIILPSPDFGLTFQQCEHLLNKTHTNAFLSELAI